MTSISRHGSSWLSGRTHAVHLGSRGSLNRDFVDVYHCWALMNTILESNASRVYFSPNDLELLMERRSSEAILSLLVSPKWVNMVEDETLTFMLMNS